ncbi:MAG: YfhO family protein [Myxacorys chilensis ATA2-1-KO14]|nr:YfhO family protein [Myxacorys chilensis ATA2-1-KO14]
MAYGDALAYYLPAFSSPRTLWTPLLFSGFPIAADPQIQTWYPLSLLFSLLPHAWNSFVICAYVLASCFTYGYVHSLTQSKLAATISGFTYGLSGFMIAHLYHTTMIHAAAWIPLIIWALDRLRYRFDKFWFGVGTISVACCFLSGHPQISVYGIGLTIAYGIVFGWTAPHGRWKYYRLASGIFSLGILLSSIQLIPTVQLAPLSLRSEMTFQNFVGFSLPAWQAGLLLFPYLTGKFVHSAAPDSSPSLYKIAYWGEWNWAELTGYVGLLPVMLAVIAVYTYCNRQMVWFWLGVGLLALLLAFGNSTPLAQLVYHFIPAYNKFRAQGRHFVEVDLAFSVLAGLGVASMQRFLAPHRLVLKIVFASGSVMLASLGAIVLFSKQLKTKALSAGVDSLPLLPWSNPAIGVPLVVFVVSAATLLYWSRRKSRWSYLALLIALLIDLGSFGQFSYWQYLFSKPSALIPTASVQTYQQLTESSQQRILTMSGYLGSLSEIIPNLSRLWRVPNASGYTPMTLARISQLYSISADGIVSTASLDKSDRSLDLMAVRYLFMPTPVRIERKGIAWSDENLSLTVGSGDCATNLSQSITLNVPEQRTTAIGFVTSLACSTTIPNLTPVVNVSITDTQGRIENRSLKAGPDTAEWAADCADIKPQLRHQRAPVFSSVPVLRENLTCSSNNYVSILQLNQTQPLKTLSLQWTGGPGVIMVKKISLIDDTDHSLLLSDQSRNLHNTSKWRYVETVGDAIVYENQQAMPRAWLVPEVVAMAQEDILRTIKTSKLPDGRPYDPSQIALTEEDFTLKSLPQKLATAKTTLISDTQVEVQTESTAPAFLVLSDVYYPGWRVSIDGKSTHLFSANYVLRGVSLPEGRHTVKFEFKPQSFHVGVGISTAALFVLGYVLLRAQSHLSISEKR